LIKNDQFAALFDPGTLLDLYAASKKVIKLSKKDKKEIGEDEMIDVTKTFVGVMTNFDPTGISNIVKAFLYS